MTISSMVLGSAARYEVMNSMKGSAAVSSSSVTSTKETSDDYSSITSLTATEELYDIDGDGELSTQEEAKMEQALEAKKAAREQISGKMQSESNRISSRISPERENNSVNEAADQGQDGSVALLQQKMTEQYARQRSRFDDWKVVNYAV